MSSLAQNKSLNILLADDDVDDRFFFGMALKALPYTIDLTTVENGEKLMDHLNANTAKLPDVLFLDLNMPRKNGSECLSEIKTNPKLRQLPVIIYSTSINEDVADSLYKNGAHNYVPKQDLPELIKVLNYAVTLIIENKFAQPNREQFILKLASSNT
jgi:CheY-like chemotaxis protein